MYNDIKELEHLLTHLTKQYDAGEECNHPDTGESISDNKYDELVRNYETIAGHSFDFKSIPHSKVLKKVQHDTYMTSIDKCNGTADEKKAILNKFLTESKQNSGGYATSLNDFFVMSYKLDGCALSLKYKAGVLESAGLRTDGHSGEDVTALAKHITSIPNKLNKKVSCTIRGEVVCLKSDFDSLVTYANLNKQKAPKNARNYVAGALKKSHKSVHEIHDRKLTFIAYSYGGNATHDTYIESLEHIEWLGFDHDNVIYTEHYDYNTMMNWAKSATDMPMLIDGIVVTCNYLINRDKIGHHNNNPENNPKWNIAYKFADEVKTTTVESIDWSVGRSGELYPVLNVTPTKLEDTTVRRCTAHNAGYLSGNGIGIGSRIEIIKSGKIIPKVHKVITTKPYDLPTYCPACGSSTIVDGSNGIVEHLECSNTRCKGRFLEMIEHYLKTLGVKGIGSAAIKKIYDDGNLSSCEDLYNLNMKSLMLGGFTGRQAALFLASLYMLKENEGLDVTKCTIHFLEGKLEPYLLRTKKIEMRFYKLFASFGIDGCGTTMSKVLEREYPMKGKSIFTCTVSELESIDGIGRKTSESISTYLVLHNNVITRMISNIFKIVCPVVDTNSTSKISGKTFCFTGGFTGGKKFWEAEVEGKGGIIKKSFSKKLDYMVVGEKSGAKKQKAIDAGVTTLTEDELDCMLKE